MRFLILLSVASVLLFVGSATASNIGTSLSVSPSPAAVGDVVTGAGCGYQANHWFEMDTYGPNAAVDGPLDSSNINRVGSDGCISGTLLNPARASGPYSVYVYDCGAKSTGIGCAYGSHTKVLLDEDFTVG